MRKFFFSTVALYFVVQTAVFTQEPEWNNSSVNQVNEEQPRAYFIHYPSEQLAGSANPSQSPWIMNLGGNWQYNLVRKPTLRIKEFPLPDFDASAWERIAIPEKDENKRNIDTIRSFSKTNNPVASYRKVFPIPEDWYNTQIFVRFDGVSQACYVWLNGKRVGYTESGMHGAEFNITPYVQYGRMNTLAVQVYGWCDGSTVEQPDSVWGLYSNVAVLSVPNLAIRDFYFKSDVANNSKSANILLNLSIKKYKSDLKGKYKLIFSLKDDKNKDIFTPLTKDINTAKNADSLVVFNQTVSNIKTWQTNDVNLYTLVVTLRDNDNKVIDAIGSKVGFRNISKINNEITINNNAVNADSIGVLQLFRTMNALDNCNKQGIYLTDQLVQPSGNNSNELIYRARKHFERDKNQTCIVRWNIGNKNSENYQTINNWLQEKDKTRVIE
jgi:beta-galactosidase